MKLKFLAAIACASLLASCGGGGSNDADYEKSLTLEQKAGQMVMMGVSGTTPEDPAVREAITQVGAGELGGVILFRYNVTGPEQVRALTTAIAQANPLPYPVLVAADQEGGLVQRFRASNGFFDTPSHEDVAATQSSDEAYATWSRMAQMLATAGINFNFGPVVDLRSDPAVADPEPVSPVIGQLERAFSSDPATIVRYATQFVQAHRDAGVLTALKHWPGHGLATGDTHLSLVDVTQTARPLEQVTFQSLINAGMADAVMTAHLMNRSVDTVWPVTLSERFIAPLLRGLAGFGGVVVTDDLHMGAIQLEHSSRETIVQAIRAGNDVLVFSNNPAAAANVPGFTPRYDMGRYVGQIVRDAVNRGELTASQVDAAWLRVRHLRARLALHEGK